MLTLPLSRYPRGDKIHPHPQFKKYFIHPWISSTYPLRLNYGLLPLGGEEGEELWS